MKRINILLLLSILIAGCQSNTNTGTTENPTKTEVTIAYKLATLESGGYVSDSDQIVKRFDNLIQQIEIKYILDKQQIGDMTYKLKEVAANRGITVSMIKVMEGATQVNNITYAEYLGQYLTLIEKGYTHEKTLLTIKLLE